MQRFNSFSPIVYVFLDLAIYMAAKYEHFKYFLSSIVKDLIIFLFSLNSCNFLKKYLYFDFYNEGDLFQDDAKVD